MRPAEPNNIDITQLIGLPFVFIGKFSYGVGF